MHMYVEIHLISSRQSKNRKNKSQAVLKKMWPLKWPVCFRQNKAGQVFICPKQVCSPAELPSCQTVQLEHVTKILLYCKDIHNNFYSRLQVYTFTVVLITRHSALFGLFILAGIPKVEARESYRNLVFELKFTHFK